MLIILAVVLTLLLFAAFLAVRGYLRATREPPRPRLEARVTLLENLSDDLDKRLEYLTTEMKSVRGRQFAMEKHKHRDVDEPVEENPNNTNTSPVPRAYVPTAHLARRFKGA